MRLTFRGPGLTPDQVVLAPLSGLPACTPQGDGHDAGVRRRLHALLGRQDEEPHAGCRTTDGVVRHPVREAA